MSFFLQKFRDGIKSLTQYEFSTVRGPSGRSSSIIHSNITGERAMTLSAVFACIKIISEDVGGLPYFVYRRAKSGISIADSHSVYGLLHDSPNPDMTAIQFREALTSHALLCGSAYAKIERSRSDSKRIIALWPLMPYQVRRDQDYNNRVTWFYMKPNGTQEQIPNENLFQLHGFGTNGINGLNVMQYARDVIGLGLSQQEYASRFFAQNQTPDIVLKHPHSIGPDGVAGVKKSWKEHFQGEDKWFSPAILQENMDIVQLRPNNQQSQLIEQRSAQVLEVCRVFRMPPHKLAEMGRATWGNISAQNTQYYNETLRPWLVRWEQGCNMRLLGFDSGYYAEHEIAGMLRGDFDMQTRGFRTLLLKGSQHLPKARLS